MEAVSYTHLPWILLADEQGNVKLTDKQVQQLVKILTDNQGANGLCQGAYWGKTYDDIDTTGTALAALARFAKATEDPYDVKDQANTFITKALAGLGKAQGENGSFGNVNTDAMVIAGLAAIGKNPSNFKNNNSSLADALTLYVNEGQNGFSSGYAAGTAGEKAVSYTHLDVYKSQVLHGPATVRGERVFRIPLRRVCEQLLRCLGKGESAC